MENLQTAVNLIHDPVIKATWTTDSALFAILCQSSNAYRWIMNYYIQIYSDGMEIPHLRYIPHHDPFFEWSKCPFLECQKIGRNIIDSKWHSVSEFIVEGITQGYYVLLHLDQYHIRKGEAKREHIVHVNFFHGYNPQTNQLVVSDHFDYGKYSTILVDYMDVNSAYTSSKELLSKIYHNWIVLTKFYEVDYSFNTALLYSFLSDYVNSTNSFRSYVTYTEYNSFYAATNVLGLDNYNSLIRYIQDNLDDHLSGLSGIDIKPFTFLYDHKVIMKLRLDFLSREVFQDRKERISVIRRRFERICKDCLTCRNLVIKYMLEGGKKALYRAIELLKGLQDCERITLLELIDIISA